MNKNLPPIRYTTSCSLLLLTLFFLVATCGVYFFWYLEGPISFGPSVKEKPSVPVKPGDDLGKMLQQVQSNTTLLLDPGTYRGNFKLTNKSGISLKGTGASSGEVVLHSPTGHALAIQDCVKCEIENLSIKTDAPKLPALWIVHSEKIVGKRIIAEGVDYSIQAQAKSSDIELMECKLSGTLELQECARVSLEGNLIEASNQVALKMYRVSQVTLDKNEIKGTQGILMKEVSSEKSYENCLLRNRIVGSSKEAFVLEHSSAFSITSSEFESEKEGAALSVLKCEKIQIGKFGLRNKVKASSGSALEISGSQEITVTDGWFSNQGKESPCLRIEVCSHVQLLKNRIVGLVEYKDGEVLDVKGGGVTISKSLEVKVNQNQISYATAAGVLVEKDSVVFLANNRVENNRSSGIEVIDSQATISLGNHVSKNRTGIVFRKSRGSISENKIKENKREGILLENSSPSIVKNEIAQNDNDGLSLQESYPEIKENQFISNKGYGIWFSQPPIQTPLVSWKQENSFDRNQRGDSNYTK